jgi:hypothetical protein
MDLVHIHKTISFWALGFVLVKLSQICLVYKKILATCVSPNMFIIKIYSTIYLMVLIMYLSGIDSRHTQPKTLIVCQLLNHPRLRNGFCLTRALMTSSKHPTHAPHREQSPPRPTLQRKHGSVRPPWHTFASPERHVGPSGKAGSHVGPHHDARSH